MQNQAYQLRTDVLKLLGDVDLAKSIHLANATLGEFDASFRHARPSTTRFMVVVLRKMWRYLEPVGLLVDEVDDAGYIGRFLSNDISKDEPTKKATVSRECVVDWSFVDLWEMQGGEVWKAIYRLLSSDQQLALTGAMRPPFNPCVLDLLSNEPSPEHREQQPQDRALIRQIVERKSTYAIEGLQQRRPSDRFPCTLPPLNGFEYRYLRRLNAWTWVVGAIGTDEIVLGLCHPNWRTQDAMFEIASFASPRGNMSVMRSLVELGLDLNRCDASGSLLNLAVNFKQSEMADWLMDSGIDVNLTGRQGNAAIHCVKDPVIALKLLSLGADPRALAWGMPAISHHLREGNWDVAEVILNYLGEDLSVLEQRKRLPSIMERGRKLLNKFQRETYGFGWTDITVRCGRALPFRQLKQAHDGAEIVF